MISLEHNYKSLKLAQDLPKGVLRKVALKISKLSEGGVYVLPPDEEVIKYLNNLAKEKKINHYLLKGEYEQIVLFDKDDVLNDFDIWQSERRKVTELVKIQCYDQKITTSDNIPIEISSIQDLYKVPPSTFNSGSCIYFLCKDEEVVYVGQAENIHSRLIEHSKYKEFDAVYYIRVSAHKMNKIESSLIGYLKPKYNKASLKLTNQKKSIAESILLTNQKIQNGRT